MGYIVTWCGIDGVVDVSSEDICRECTVVWGIVKITGMMRGGQGTLKNCYLAKNQPDYAVGLGRRRHLQLVRIWGGVRMGTPRTVDRICRRDRFARDGTRYCRVGVLESLSTFRLRALGSSRGEDGTGIDLGILSPTLM